jgi:hypothetical protein
MGPRVASKFLQRWLSALNMQGKLYPDLIRTARLATHHRRAEKLSRRSWQRWRNHAAEGAELQPGARYLELAEARPANEAFLYGWVKERVSL